MNGADMIQQSGMDTGEFLEAFFGAGITIMQPRDVRRIRKGWN